MKEIKPSELIRECYEKILIRAKEQCEIFREKITELIRELEEADKSGELDSELKDSIAKGLYETLEETDWTFSQLEAISCEELEKMTGAEIIERIKCQKKVIKHILKSD